MTDRQSKLQTTVAQVAVVVETMQALIDRYDETLDSRYLDNVDDMVKALGGVLAQDPADAVEAERWA